MTHPIVAKAAAEGRGKLREDEALALLKAYGIPTPEYAVARDEEEAVRAAEQIGYPVAAKIVSPQIVHKTDVGGVILGIADPQGVREACRRLREVVERVPYAELEASSSKRWCPKASSSSSARCTMRYSATSWASASAGYSPNSTKTSPCALRQ